MIRFLQTPGRLQKLLLGGILLIVCVMMVITLIPGGFLGDALGFSSSERGVLAKVGDQEVTITEAQQMARQIGRQQFSRNIPSQLMPFLMQRAVENLITQKAVLAEAARMGLKVSDEELRDELQHGPLAQSFFPNGNFIGQDRYEDLVQSQWGVGVAQFEQLLKTDLAMRKLRNVVEGGISVSDAELREQYQRENTKVKFEYAVLATDETSKQIHPTESELKAYYDKNKESYVNAVPEKRKVQYVVIDRSKLAGKTQVTPEEIKNYYNQHQDQYRIPEQVNVRHILIKTPAPGPDGKVDQKAVDAAKAKAEDILKQVKAGGNFAELAKKYSEDTASAKSGGTLGWIERGRTVPEFERTAFSLGKGQTSDVVRSSYGFHIIRVDDKQQAHVKPLDDVKSSIEPLIAEEKATREAENLANALQAQARTTSTAGPSASLEKAAGSRGLEMMTSGLIARTDSLPGIGAAPEFMEAIFNAREKTQPTAVKIPQGYAVFQLLETKPASTPSFEDIKPRAESDFKAERAAALLSQKTQELSDRARAEHDLKKAASAVGATIKTSELVSPTSQLPDIGQMNGPASVAFAMKPGDISAPLNTGRGGVVLKIIEKQEPPSADFDKAKDQLRETLLERKRQERFSLFISDLRRRMEKEGKIRINQKEMNRITTPVGS